MAAPKREIGAEILEGLRQLKRGEHGGITTVPSVAAVREGTGLSQSRFAELLGVSVRTPQEWEQGRRAPSGAARTLLFIETSWPDFDGEDLRRAVEAFRRRERRYGGLTRDEAIRVAN